jgi:hypothetical protein
MFLFQQVFIKHSKEKEISIGKMIDSCLMSVDQYFIHDKNKFTNKTLCRLKDGSGIIGLGAVI